MLLPQFSEPGGVGVASRQAADPAQSGSLQSTFPSPSSSAPLLQFSTAGGMGAAQAGAPEQSGSLQSMSLSPSSSTLLAQSSATAGGGTGAGVDSKAPISGAAPWLRSLPAKSVVGRFGAAAVPASIAGESVRRRKSPAPAFMNIGS